VWVETGGVGEGWGVGVGAGVEDGVGVGVGWLGSGLVEIGAVISGVGWFVSGLEETGAGMGGGIVACGPVRYKNKRPATTATGTKSSHFILPMLKSIKASAVEHNY